VSAYRLIDAEKVSFPVVLLCKMLRVSRSGYYGWRDRPPSRRARENDALTSKIHEIHQRSLETYGSPRIHAELRSIGVRCSRKRVARLMRKEGLEGCVRGRRKRPARRGKHDTIPAEDLVCRDFSAAALTDSGRRTLLMSVLIKAFCNWRSSSMPTLESSLAGRWRVT
jgi:putative transposase